MALCNTCEWYNKEYDEYRGNFDDIITVDGDRRPNHFCIAYDEKMPKKIWYKNGNCPFYKKKGTER